MQKHHILRPFVLAIAVAGAAALLFLSPAANQGLLTGLDAIRSAGVWGPLLLIAVYIAGCVLFVPGSVLTMGAGFLFGIPVGVVTVSIGSTLGSVVAFLLSRTLVRDRVVRRLAANPRFCALDEAVGRHGFKIVLLTRLSPMFPFNLLNFAFGATRVSLRDYALASWVGMLPGALLYVYVGSAVNSLAELTAGRGTRTFGENVLFAVGLAATAAVSLLLTRAARQALHEASALVPPEGPSSLRGPSQRNADVGSIARVADAANTVPVADAASVGGFPRGHLRKTGAP